MSDDDIFNSYSDDFDDDDDDDNGIDESQSTQELELGSQYDKEEDSAKYSALTSIVNTYSAFMWSTPAKLIDDEIFLEIPTYVLPLAQQVVYGFNTDKTLLNISIVLNDYSWTKRPEHIKVSNPVFGTKFVGSALISSVIDDFFSPFFKPRQYYRSSSYLLTPPGKYDTKLVEKLVDEGFESNIAENALALFRNNYDAARDFLRTGGDVAVDNEINISYKECPLLYFALEVVEALFDLQDHCCICRAELKDYGIKPSVCDKKLCQFALTEIGIGNSVYQEIQRDYLAADLLVSAFSCAVGTEFLTPAPPDFNTKEMQSILEKLPSMKVIIQSYQNDKEMISGLGERKVQLLRWILLSNKSQILSLTDDLILPQFGNCKMFMALLSSPLKEEEFRKRQTKYGSMYLWHGSGADRWHSIIRNGLINASGTKLQANGAAFGNGIYLARNSSTSRGYTRTGLNLYKNSSLGSNFNCIGLCQIAKVPQIADNGWNHVLQDDKACVVRFLIVNLNKDIDILDNPLKNVPTLRDVLEHHANKA